MKKFLVTNKHGRVFRRIDPYTRVLVAIPGDEISIELARECGLLDPPEEKAPEPEPEPETDDEKGSESEKPEPETKAQKPPAKKLSGYPTKTHKA